MAAPKEDFWDRIYIIGPLLDYMVNPHTQEDDVLRTGVAEATVFGIANSSWQATAAVHSATSACTFQR